MAAPNAPIITLTRLSATSFRVAITGDAGETHELRYKKSDESAWTDGGNRVGDGNIDKTSLTTGDTFICIVRSENVGGEKSELGTGDVVITVTADTDTGTPAGGLSLPLDNLEETIAGSTTFREWVGATGGTEEENIAAAKLRIYKSEVEAGDWTRPYAWIDQNENWEADKRAEPNAFGHRGELLLGFEANYSSGDSVATALYKFTNKCGAIINEMLLLSGVYPYLPIVNVRIEEGPIRSAPEERTSGDTKEYFYQIRYGIEWQ